MPSLTSALRQLRYDSGMKLAKIAALVAVASCLSLALPSTAAADQAQLSAQCTWAGGVECSGQCDVAGYGFRCGLDIDAQCKAKLPTACQVNANAQCNVSCEADCSTKCKVDPPTFSCSADCEARVQADCSLQVDAECNGQCNASADQAKCKGDCKAKLTGRCQGAVAATCEAECSGQPGSVDCSGQCKASCKGSCDADVKIKCNGYLSCQANANLTCESDAKLTCTGGCKSNGGGLFCSQNFITSGTLSQIQSYFAARGYARGSSSSSCVGNTCSAEASGEAGCHCSVPGGAPSAPGSNELVGVGLVAMVGAVFARVRRR